MPKMGVALCGLLCVTTGSCLVVGVSPPTPPYKGPHPQEARVSSYCPQPSRIPKAFEEENSASQTCYLPCGLHCLGAAKDKSPHSGRLRAIAEDTSRTEWVGHCISSVSTASPRFLVPEPPSVGGPQIHLL